MIRIIINADDLGVNPIVNHEIELALRDGWISSATILANSLYLDDVKKITELYGDTKSFGVHLNITEGQSLTNNPVLLKAGMIDDNGRFMRERNFRSRLYDKSIKEAVLLEWDAQINEVLSKGIKISHVDGHHHCHTWFGFTDVLCSVLKTYNLTKVRNTYISPFQSRRERLMDYVSEKLLNFKLVDASKDIKINRFYAPLRAYQDKYHFLESTRGFIKTDYFDSYESFCNKLGEFSTNGMNDTMDNSVIELMCHPGHPTYLKEFKMITSDKLGVRQDTSIHLINYKEL